ncbi:MAG: diguanylate cyclase [Myxococcales bacterium]|nr:diguanylate cyclase [Myxococcales bacterium]MCB9582014.1 diguanylate cyclase [Polyangiaceae bacterium]
MTDSRNDEVAPLQVLAILEDGEAKAAIQRAAQVTADVVSFSGTLEDGLDHAQAELPDVVFLEVTLSEAAGVALVHHLKAIDPRLRIYVLVPSERLELGAQAMSLGAAGIVMMPPSGDELLSALSDTRGRVGADAVRARLERESSRAQMQRSVASALSRLGASETRREVADRITEVLLEHTGADNVAVYVPAGERSRDLLRLAHRGMSEPPAMGDEMALHRFAAEHGLLTQKLEIGNETTGILVLGGLECYGRTRGELLELVSGQSAAALALIAAREQAQRGAMKDPGSSAYTFAYFVDVAGREIDKARRHGRRFALLTLTLEDEAAPEAFSVELAERVLATVRATDVLARVDDREFYLLLPETGGLGVHTLRRRLQSRLAGVRGGRRGEGEPLKTSIGTAVYPHDGSALSSLLRTAKRRAEASSTSLVHSLNAGPRPLDEVLEALFWCVAEKGEAVDADRLRTIELPLMDLVGLASAALSEAVRGGAARVVASQGPGLGVGAAVRSAPGADRGEVEITVTEASSLSGGRDIEALAIVAEHGTYALLGRRERGVVRAVHAADPLLTDLVLDLVTNKRNGSNA